MGIEKYKLSMTSPEVNAALQRAASGGTLDQQLQRKVNPNLLDNWYFGNPVNQRGQTEYTGLTYCIDRWKLQYVTQLAIVDGGVKLTGNWDITEYFENMPAGTYTLSLLYKDSSTTDLHADINEASGNLIKRATTTQLSGLMSVTTTTDKLGGVVIGFLGGAENSATLIAAKLELGDTQTLAHKEGDEWVLNEIPNYGEQLRRCQRYYIKTKLRATLSRTDSVDAHQVFAPTAPVIPPMRTVPAATISNIQEYYSGDAKTIYTQYQSYTSLFPGFALNESVNDNLVQFDCELSADL